MFSGDNAIVDFFNDVDEIHRDPFPSFSLVERGLAQMTQLTVLSLENYMMDSMVSLKVKYESSL